MGMRRSIEAVLLLLIATAVTSPSVHAQKLQAVVVGDLSPAAGWGVYAPNITLDMSNMFAVIHDNVPQNRLVYRSLQMTQDSDSDPAKVLAAIDALSAAPQDTILFYFSGHGAADEQGQHYLALAKGKLPRQQLIDRLKGKRAKMVILVTDCCNSRSDGKRMFAPAPGYESPPTVTPLFKSLMFDPTGLVDINSSSPGESAFFKAQDPENPQLPGSIFTSELTNWMFEHKAHARTWDDLVRAVSLQVHSSFRSNYPKGAQVAKGSTLQTDQNVYPITYPGMPEKQGPRTGFVVRDFEGKGAVIINVAPGSPAAEVYDVLNRQFAALKPQQVIISVNGKPVSGVDQLVKMIQEAPQIVRLGVRDARAGDVEYLLRMKY